MMEYKIVTALSTALLEIYVKDYVKNGWKPTGGVAVRKGGWADLDEYSQAMVKE